MVIHNCLMTALIIITYTLAIMVPSAIVLYPKVKNRSLSMRLAIYFICGNTFGANLVYILVFLHILYTPVVWVALIVLTIVASFKTRGVPLKNLPYYIIRFLLGLLGNDLGGRYASRQLAHSIGRSVKACGRWFKKYVVRRLPEVILGVLMVVLVFYLFRQELTTTFGYHAYDIPVHNYWINEMIMHQKLFAAGLYPFGFHVVIAYFYMLFRIPIMDILSMFNFVIIIYTVFFMAILGKKLTKSLFAGYIAPFLYFGFKYINAGIVRRYSSPLPQEFGLIFLLTGVLFAIDFFRKNKKEKDYARQDAYMFAFSVGMCLSAHLYTGIALFAACVAIAVSHLTQFVRRSYLLPLLRSGILGLVLALWAMGVGALMGIPLQGSAGWAMSVANQQTTAFTDETNNSTDNSTSSASSSVSPSDSGDVTEQPEPEPIWRRAVVRVQEDIDIMSSVIAGNVFYSDMSYDAASRLSYFIIYAMIIFSGLSFVLRIRDVDYGRNLLFVNLFLAVLIVMSTSLALGLRQIVEMIRAMEFMIMWSCIAMGVWADSVITLVIGFRRRSQRIIIDIISAALIVTGAYEFHEGYLRESFDFLQMETNGAITSITNIMRDNTDHTYTVVSANDELHMMEMNGYHVEVDELLHKIEHPDNDTSFTIPTSKVYFFIEKIPLTYYDIGIDENKGRMVSSAGAKKSLPEADGSFIYVGDNRYTEMSRLYYFARELMKRFPEHTHVYYNDRNFICVCLDQNVNAPMNLAFDYGYNK